MKTCLIISWILFVNLVFSQARSPGQFYQTENEAYAFTFDNHGCTLYQLERKGNYLYYTGQDFLAIVHDFGADSSGILFSNGRFAVSYDYTCFQVLKLKRGKSKSRLTYTARKLNNPSQIYEAMNYKTWEELYQKTIEETRADYPLYTNYNYAGQTEIWNRLSYKQAEPELFIIQAKERIAALRDTLKRENWKMLSLNNEVERNDERLTIDELKQNFSSRITSGEYNRYTDEMLVILAENRPDLFFGLVESFPVQRDYFFASVVFVKSANKSLKNYKTNAPVKKEYLRYMRKEKLVYGLLVTGLGVLQTGVIGGAITGISYWVKN